MGKIAVGPRLTKGKSVRRKFSEICSRKQRFLVKGFRMELSFLLIQNELLDVSLQCKRHGVS